MAALALTIKRAKGKVLPSLVNAALTNPTYRIAQPAALL